MITRCTRLFRIGITLLRFRLFELLGATGKYHGFICLCRLIPVSDPSAEERPAVRLRLALESLGPIFVKFGQMLSTRRDMLPADFADELQKLQDNVPPFDGQTAQAIIADNLGHSVEDLYDQFNPIPVASASMAQVHHAWIRTPDGRRGAEVAVKILRPGIETIIEQDIALMYTMARFFEKWFSGARLLRLTEVVREFDQILHNEQDLVREASNASQMRRQFADSDLLIIPEVYFDLCQCQVLTMQWVEGIPVSQITTLHRAGMDLKKLARDGVTVFFRQVFSFGFFHADMHPGNIFVNPSDGRYIALDFGIVGSLTDYDKRYLAINFLAFFNRDYHRVASAHIECGWVPEGTDILALESAIRTVCEPIFQKPLAQISFGLVLLRLFETCRQFNVGIQPQLVLLQKTLLNIEGLGRQLDPELDLWETAKPFLSDWMNEQLGWKGLVKNLRDEWPEWMNLLPMLPRKLDDALTTRQADDSLKQFCLQLMFVQRRQSLLLWIIAGILICLLLRLLI